MKSPWETSSSKSTWIRVLLSLFLVYHLLVIVVLANGGSFLARYLAPALAPYGNLLGLNVGWNFFAPDPAHTMYIHYRVRFEDDQHNETKEPIEAYLPPQKEKIVMDSSQRRFLYAMRFLILDEKRMKALLGPYLCRHYEGASTVYIENILEPIPNLDTSSQLSDLREKQEATILEYTHHCNEAQDEEAL